MPITDVQFRVGFMEGFKWSENEAASYYYLVLEFHWFATKYYHWDSLFKCSSNRIASFELGRSGQQKQGGYQDKMVENFQLEILM